MLSQRRAGVLLHPTSLPGIDPQGTFGSDARKFVDLIAEAGFTVWQTLPLGPADSTGSPYLLKSAHAGNPNLIDFERLVEDGLFTSAEARMLRSDWLPLLAGRFEHRANEALRAEFAEWEESNRYWLETYALYESLKVSFSGAPWWKWPPGIRDRSSSALAVAAVANAQPMELVKVTQFLFDRQWRDIHSYARARGISILGDMPFYIDHDSADAWACPSLLDLDTSYQPVNVAGVPPDYFSEDGQWWGNPVYDWSYHKSNGFSWWLQRMETQHKRFDGIRIDHFRALESFWAIPAKAESAREGCWIAAPGEALLGEIKRKHPDFAIVAEDLGTITDAVRSLRDQFRLPGMLILQFAFDGSTENPYLPQNHVSDAVVYTGTHDNDTTLGWYQSLDTSTRTHVDQIIDGPAMPDALIEAAYYSQANLAIIPMQDLLALGSEARMNIPGTVVGNWRWRFKWSDVPADFAQRFCDLAGLSGRDTEWLVAASGTD